MEEQFILRVPPRVAEQIRELLQNAEKEQVPSSKDKKAPKGPREKDLGLEFTVEHGDSNRNVMMRIGREEFIGTFVDLPCLIESHKTYDNVNYFKSQDISQMMLVHDPSEEDFPVVNYDSEYKFASGITPPTRNIRKRKFRRPTDRTKQEIESVEQEIMKLMRGGTVGEDESIEIVDNNLDDELVSPGHSKSNTPITTPITTPMVHDSSILSTNLSEESSQDGFASSTSMDASGAKRKREDKKEKKPKKSKLEKKEKKLQKKLKKVANAQASHTPGSFKINVPRSQLSPVTSPGSPSSQGSPISPETSNQSKDYSPVIPSHLSGLSPNSLLSPGSSRSAFSPSLLETSPLSANMKEGLDALQKDMQENSQSDSTFMNLKEEEITLSTQLTAINRNISDMDLRLKGSINAVLRERFAKKKAEYEEQKIIKLQRLSEVQIQLSQRI